MKRDMTRTKTDPTPADESSTRQKIFAAALHEFAVYGKEGARIDRIALSAGVNKAMIYYHFRSKEELHKEVVVSHYQRVRERIVEEIGQDNSVEEALRTLARIHAETARQNPQMVPLLLRELADPKEEIIEAIAQVLSGSGIPNLMRSLIQREAAAGRIRKVDPRQAMVAFISMSLGYYLLSPIIDRIIVHDDRPRFINERPEAIVDIFLNGLRTK